MVKKVLQIGSPILTRKTELVTDALSPEVKQVVADLIDTCLSKIEGTAGLSAPQIGYGVRVCVCRRTDMEDAGLEVSGKELWEVMINPQIIQKSTQTSTFWEGCLSIGVGDNQLFGPVTRSSEVEVEYLDISGRKKKLAGKKFFAHVIQHELDHLDGVLFLSYIDNPENIWRNKELDEYLNKNNTYPPIK